MTAEDQAGKEFGFAAGFGAYPGPIGPPFENEVRLHHHGGGNSRYSIIHISSNRVRCVREKLRTSAGATQLWPPSSGWLKQSHLPVRRTLEKLGVSRATFYRWCDLSQTGGTEALEDRS